MEHDIIYKQMNGPPSKRLEALVEILKGNVNQAEVIGKEIEDVQIEDIDDRVRLGFEKLEPQCQSAEFDSLAAAGKMAARVADEVIQQKSKILAEIADHLSESRREQHGWHQSYEVSKCLQALYQCDYKAQKQRNPERVAGTCRCFLQSEKYLSWIKSESSDLVHHQDIFFRPVETSLSSEHSKTRVRLSIEHRYCHFNL